MFYNLSHRAEERVAYVDLRSGHENIPTHVEFTFSDESTIKISIAEFQRLRLLLHPGQEENKIQLIKMVRGLYDLCLRDSKLLAEWFIENFDRSAQSYQR